jgi:hypothetical protein
VRPFGYLLIEVGLNAIWRGRCGDEAPESVEQGLSRQSSKADRVSAVNQPIYSPVAALSRVVQMVRINLRLEREPWLDREPWTQRQLPYRSGRRDNQTFDSDIIKTQYATADLGNLINYLIGIKNTARTRNLTARARATTSVATRLEPPPSAH